MTNHTLCYIIFMMNRNRYTRYSPQLVLSDANCSN
nr:MAG TPA: hypothetical protein [Caudoviricetes sp.]